MLADIITDVLFQKLRIDDTISACMSGFQDSRPVSLIVAGPTGHQAAVEKHLKSANIKYDIKQHEGHNLSKAGHSSGSVAVVGMAARLPGSDTVEGFFENLVEGKVQLKKVRLLPRAYLTYLTIKDTRVKIRHQRLPRSNWSSTTFHVHKPRCIS
jgi:hypothetical protein